MSMNFCAHRWMLGLFLAAMLAGCGSGARAGSSLHAQVLVFVPAYEASQLWDPDLETEPTCVWGNFNVLLSSKRYFALRLPNPLTARTLLSVGPLDVYGKFIHALTQGNETTRGFTPYTEGADFFVFDYDWRRDIGTVSAPLLGQALERYARIHEAKTGIPAQKTRFVIVTHSMGGLVARTMLSERPEWAGRVSKLYLVGSPNSGSVKSIRTVVYGPDSIQSVATGFPGVLLNLIPTDVDQNVTKLTAISRLSLYELLPFGDPHWTSRAAGRRMGSEDILAASSWEPYWPTAELEKRLYLNGWLKDREAEGRKKIASGDWEFCQDSTYAPLKKILTQVKAWHERMGSLAQTSELMTRAGEQTRLRLIVGTGLKTPTGVVTEGEHDASTGYYTYKNGDGDGTVETVRNLEGVPSDAFNVKLLRGVTHGKLMSNEQFVAYFLGELAGEKLVGR